MTVFETLDYKQFVQAWFKRQPKQGRGQLKRIADYLGVHPVFTTQVFNGDRDLTPEQALQLCEYLGLSGIERDYFVLLVQYARAGHHQLKAYHLEQLEALRLKAKDLANLVPHEKFFDEGAKAIFYSDWYYSGVRILTAIKESISTDELATRLALTHQQVNKVLEFLLSTGLCVRTAQGIQPGPQVTHLEKSSLLVNRHHSNWRLKAMEQMRTPSTNDFFYSGPMALSEELKEQVFAELAQLVKGLTERVRVAEAEVPACLNIDWFRF